MIAQSVIIFNEVAKISAVGERFRKLGKCSKCPVYSKCKGLGLIPISINPDKNPKNPDNNPKNPRKNFKEIKGDK